MKKSFFTKDIIKKILPLQFGLVNYIAFGILLFYLIRFQIKSGMEHLDFSFSSLIVLFTSILSITLLLQLNSLLSAGFRKIKVIADCIIIFLFSQLFAYQYFAKTNIDFDLVIDNIGIAATEESISVITSNLGMYSITGIFIIISAMIYCEFKWKMLSRHIQENPIAQKIFVTLMIYILLIFFNVPTRDNITYFIQSINRYYTYNYGKIHYQEGTYPFFKTGIEFSDKPLIKLTGREKPNIIIIMIESFNGMLVEQKSPEGYEYTPYMNSLIKKGLYIKNFYGNSIQTSKGQFAALFSTIPSLKGKVYVHYSKKKFSSLQEILKDYGYQTLFYQAYKDITFDNTDRFLLSNGFDNVISADPGGNNNGKGELNNNNRLKWGIEDGEFYRRFFSYINENHQKKNKPLFACLATVANHMYFDSLPKDRMFLYKNPVTFKEKYANSLYISDQQLSVFMDEMEKIKWMDNTIVIITGDHSFPLGDHDITHNEAGYFEESFRIPFVMLWKGKLEPYRIDKIPFSQMDIAPTILDILKLYDVPNSFQGISINSFYDRLHPIFLVQPYSGKIMSVVEYPYKYVFIERTLKESLFNIETDPQEKDNLILDINLSEVLKKMQKSVNTIYLNQRLIELDKINPGKEGKK